MSATGLHLPALVASSETFAATIESDEAVLALQVPACPGWDVARLAGHLGRIYSWVCKVTAADGKAPEAKPDSPPTEAGELPAWFRSQREGVIEALGAPAETPVWVFVEGVAGDIGWWRRRQALETAVHLWDLEQAVGRSYAVPAELAADGVDEVLSLMLPRFLGRNEVPGLRGSLHLHCTDTEGEWTLRFDGEGASVAREHSKADAALRGPASDLFLWTWNRIGTDAPSLEVFGDQDIVAAFASVKL